MSLLLVIDTSARPFEIALGRVGACLYSARAAAMSPNKQDLAALVTEALRASGQSLRDLTGIAVNIGPGALGSVRSGVSFANALAYSLGVPVHPVTSFELMGFAAAAAQECPVLCTARASAGQAYLGVFAAGRLSVMTFGALDALAPATVAGLDRVAIAGDQRAALCTLLRNREVIDSGVDRGTAATYLQWAAAGAGEAKAFPEVATPITEDSALLRDAAELLR